jgi:SpoVK/Ycf46/Vps4 family AAA+-type ATPase
MATADQLKALIKSHAEGDESRFYGIALQVAAHAARSGHANFAQELRDIVEQAKLRSRPALESSAKRVVPLVQPRGELAGLLTVSFAKVRLGDMALEPEVAKLLERVLHEQRQRDRIRQHGFGPQQRLLLIGPPGTGKTMTAAALAGELAIPLFTIQLDGLITKFMGETAAKLRLVFDAVQQTRAVYFFDEFDALGSERASRNDVGEIRRVLNSFLQFLELDESDSLIVAATNHPQLLDRALFRRFDSVIEYGLPGRPIAAEVMRARLAPLETAAVDWAGAAEAAEGLSHAEIVRACEHAAKNAILAHTTVIDQVGLIAALRERRAPHG